MKSNFNCISLDIAIKWFGSRSTINKMDRTNLLIVSQISTHINTSKILIQINPIVKRQLKVLNPKS